VAGHALALVVRLCLLLLLLLLLLLRLLVLSAVGRFAPFLFVDNLVRVVLRFTVIGQSGIVISIVISIVVVVVDLPRHLRLVAQHR
jgi:predicted membrane metal-binding protein